MDEGLAWLVLLLLLGSTMLSTVTAYRANEAPTEYQVNIIYGDSQPVIWDCSPPEPCVRRLEPER